MVIGYMFN